MDAFICTACGTQYTPSSVAPRECPIAKKSGNTFRQSAARSFMDDVP
jgi:rubrerythrin